MSGLKRLGIGLGVVVLGAMTGASGFAQGPGGQGPGDGSPDGPPGMGPHRPPMERMLGPGGGIRGEHGRWWDDQKAIDKYKLTDTQRKSMDDIFQQNRVALVDLHGTLEKQELAMEPLMKADQPDEGRILQQIDRVAQARAELEKANARMLLGLRRQLTPEQWKQMEADRAAKRESRGAGGPGSDGRHWHGQPGGSPDGAPGGGQPGGQPGVAGPGLD